MNEARHERRNAAKQEDEERVFEEITKAGSLGLRSRDLAGVLGWDDFRRMDGALQRLRKGQKIYFVGPTIGWKLR